MSEGPSVDSEELDIERSGAEREERETRGATSSIAPSGFL